MDDYSDYATIPEAAEKLGVVRQRVLAMIKTGLIKATFDERFGRWLIPKSELTKNELKNRKPGRPKGSKKKKKED